MSHPVVVKTQQLIGAGNVGGAETALATVAETEGDAALVAVLEELPAKDLLAVLRDFDSSRESVVGLLVAPEQFARALLLERRYADPDHERLRGMINSVIYRAGSDAGEFLAAIGEVDGGCDVLADYLADRHENVELFFRTGSFDYFSEGIDFAAGLSDDERLDALSDAEINRPLHTHSEVNDHDWMELAWTLRYQHPEIFREVLLILRARLRAEERQQAVETPQIALISEDEEEESAL